MLACEVQAPSTVEVGRSCPVCRQGVEHKTFESLLHRDVAKLVGEMPACAHKDEWLSRYMLSPKKWKKYI